MPILKSRWMVAVELLGIPPTKPEYRILTRGRDKVNLGLVEFCPQWKHWVFVPKAERQFSDRCLTDLARFLAELNKEKG